MPPLSRGLEVFAITCCPCTAELSRSEDLYKLIYLETADNGASNANKIVLFI
jgi:GTP cyclohydrolase FolE2